MGETTGIGWTQSSFNPWIGCTKVSPGCKRCYAETLVTNVMGREFAELWRTSKANWSKVRDWDRNVRPGERHLVFCASLSDIFHVDADPWRADLWELIRETPNLTYQILTKRPERIAECLPPNWGPAGYPNVWLGTSVELQIYVGKRIPSLLAVPATVHFLSCEPLLGQIELQEYLISPARRQRIDWVIAGGESGPGARPCNPNWLREIRDYCVERGIPYFLKQLGGHPDKHSHEKAILDGRTWCEMPAYR